MLAHAISYTYTSTHVRPSTPTITRTNTSPCSHSSTPPPTNRVFICTNASKVAKVTATVSVTFTFPRSHSSTPSPTNGVFICTNQQGRDRDRDSEGDFHIPTLTLIHTSSHQWCLHLHQRRRGRDRDRDRERDFHIPTSRGDRDRGGRERERDRGNREYGREVSEMRACACVRPCACVLCGGHSTPAGVVSHVEVSCLPEWVLRQRVSALVGALEHGDLSGRQSVVYSSRQSVV